MSPSEIPSPKAWGDTSKILPTGVRGWADRVAEKLAKAQPGWEYANLAVRSKRLRHIIDEQLEPALAMEPTLVTLYAGGNDILDFGTDMDALLNDYELLVARLSETGATLVLFTGFDVKVSAVLEPFKKRNTHYNQRVRDIAARYGAVLVDYWCFDAYKDSRMWAPRTGSTCPRRATSIWLPRFWTISTSRTKSHRKNGTRPAACPCANGSAGNAAGSMTGWSRCSDANYAVSLLGTPSARAGRSP